MHSKHFATLHTLMIIKIFIVIFDSSTCYPVEVYKINIFYLACRSDFSLIGKLKQMTTCPPLPPHTIESKEKEKQHSRMQGKRSKVKNSPSEERKQSKNHCSPVKLKSKNNVKKIMDPGRDWVGKLPAIVEGKPRQKRGKNCIFQI